MSASSSVSLDRSGIWGCIGELIVANWALLTKERGAIGSRADRVESWWCDVSFRCTSGEWTGTWRLTGGRRVLMNECVCSMWVMQQGMGVEMRL